MNRVVFVAIPLVALLAACGGEESVAPPSAPPAVESSREPSPDGRVRGIASRSGDTITLRACGAPATMTLSDPDGELAQAFASLSAAPGDGIYVELDGEPAADGKTLVWTALTRAHALKEPIACGGPVFEGEFEAHGNEPFWAIEVREKGIIYRDPEIPNGRTYPYAFTRTETGSVVYATKLESPVVSTLEIALEPARCVDSMSGELRSRRAHVTLDGRKLEGCAVLGVPHGEFGNAPLDELNRFAGTYPRTVRLWDEPVIAKRLHDLLGTNTAVFHQNMQVHGPLMKDGGVFYVTGNRAHHGGLDTAIFIADPASDTISVILFVNGARRDFKEGGPEMALPAEVVTLIETMEKR